MSKVPFGCCSYLQFIWGNFCWKSLSYICFLGNVNMRDWGSGTASSFQHCFNLRNSLVPYLLLFSF